jgi:trehalose utilization protein
MDRRTFTSGLALGALGLAGAARAQARPVRVLIWDEQQPAQKKAYDNFLGNAVADHLRKKPNAFDVRSVRLDDPEQGLSQANLDATDVLVWWGHQRHGEVKVETARMLVERIRQGKLSLVALHSAHFAIPFVEAMNARTIDDALASLPEGDRAKAKVKTIPGPRRLMKPDEPMPGHKKNTLPDGTIELEVQLPSCCFVTVKDSGTPSHLATLLPNHPIARGVPEKFDIPQTEIYGGPFWVPKPDALIWDEKWDTGETFPAGCLWKLGKGQVFYFRPGHETYPIFKQEAPLRIVENSVRVLGRALRA